MNWPTIAAYLEESDVQDQDLHREGCSHQHTLKRGCSVTGRMQQPALLNRLHQ